MQQASDAMREALKGDSAASAAVSDMDVDAALEMVCHVWLSCIAETLFPFTLTQNTSHVVQGC